MLFAFHVYDSDGFWGDIRIDAATESDAREHLANDLRNSEVEPNGSLCDDFYLESADAPLHD